MGSDEDRVNESSPARAESGRGGTVAGPEAGSLRGEELVARARVLDPAALKALQRSHGNRWVQRLVLREATVLRDAAVLRDAVSSGRHLARQSLTAVPATGAGAYVAHVFCRNDGPPPNPAVPEDETTCRGLIAEAEAALTRQRTRAASLLGGPRGPVNDYRYFFAKVYSFVTENEIRFVRARAYFYPSYVLRSVLYFEQIFDDNFRAWDRRRAGDGSASPEPHWRAAFERMDRAKASVDLAAQTMRESPNREAGAGLALNFMMQSILQSAAALTEGMKAHIRWDLPRAESWVFNSYYASTPGVRLQDFVTDFMSMAGVFDRAGAQMQADMAEKLGLPVTWTPALVQDATMRHWFDADMATERADTWRRAEAIQGGAGHGPYTGMGPSGPTGGDITAADYHSQIEGLAAPMRPSMDDSWLRQSDASWLSWRSKRAVRADVTRLGRSGVAALGAVARVAMIRNLLVGYVWDEDEDTILTILGASRDAGDIVIVIDAADAWDLDRSVDTRRATLVRDYLTPYYARTAHVNVVRLLVKCIDGETSNWEKEMVLGLLDARPDADLRQVLIELGTTYDTGPDRLRGGINKLEWQLSSPMNTYRRQLRDVLTRHHLPTESGYRFSQ